MNMLPEALATRWHQVLFHCGLHTAIQETGDAVGRRVVELIEHPTVWRRQEWVQTLFQVAQALDVGVYRRVTWKAMPIALRRAMDSFNNEVGVAQAILGSLVREHGQATWQLDKTGLNPIHLLVRNLGLVTHIEEGQQVPDFLVDRATRAIEIMIQGGVDPEASFMADDPYPGRYQFADALDLACWLEDHGGRGACAIAALLNCGVDERLVLRLDTTGPKGRERIFQHPKVRARTLRLLAQETRKAVV